MVTGTGDIELYYYSISKTMIIPEHDHVDRMSVNPELQILNEIDNIN